MAHPYHEAKAKITELLRETQALRESISQLLGPADSHGVVTTGGVRRRCLAFMETELRFIEALLTTLMLNPQLFVFDTWKFVKQCFEEVRYYALHEIGSSPRRLLQRAAQCFRRTNSEGYSYTMIRQFYGDSQYTSTSYMHRLVATISDPWLAPQLVWTIEVTLQHRLSSAFNEFPSDQSRLVSLYMSMFPYDYKVEKDRLILKWIHEGFIHKGAIFWSPSELNNAKSEAETFFSQLVDRNVITCVAANCKHKHDEAEACHWQLNHSMYQFLVSISAKIGFVFTTATLNLVEAAPSATDHGNQSSSRMPRRLALFHRDPQLPSLLETIDLSHTRSLTVSGAVNSGIIPLHRFVNLVVLDFEAWENLQDEDLLQVCRSKLIFLSYLSVRNTRVSKVPHEIKELQFLLTLDISYTQITELPLEVFELGYLVHLDLRGTRINHLPKQIVGLQGALQYLLIETAAKVPHDVRRLYQLETLATVDLTEHHASFVRALGDLRELKVLAVTWSFHMSTDRDYCEAFLSCIKKWRSLKSLTIHCGLGCSMDFLGSLEKSSAPSRLENFKVTAGRFTSVPAWLHGHEHLAFLQITICNKQTTTDDLQILGGLPKLQCLILGLDFIPGQAIKIENRGFYELQRLFIYCPMPWLTFSIGAMPKLTYLQLKFCSTPASQICVPAGINNLFSITDIALCYYFSGPSIKMTVDAVTKQVAKHYRPIRLSIIDIGQDDEDREYATAPGTPSSTDATTREVFFFFDQTTTREVVEAVDPCEITGAES